MQYRDEMFHSNNPQHFRNWSPRTLGVNLVIDGSRISDMSLVVENWADHFSELVVSRCSLENNIDVFVSNLVDIEARSFLS